jgi:selenocysteine lyase/cysteine desulfurase
MKLTRRELMLAAAATPALLRPAPALSGEPAVPRLPAKAEFAPMAVTWLDAGSTHPMSLGAKAALEEYLRIRTQGGSQPGYSMGEKERTVVERFGKLVGADPDELCFVQSTTMGENLVLQALGIPGSGGRIVTDALHFFGSHYTYGELARAGMDVVTLPMTADGRIDVAGYEAAVNRDTKLVVVSLVSTVNGFEHDLGRICGIAHAAGAPVYADIVHAAGAVPTDLHASGVDFAATSSYKWLMGDFGLAFLYARRGIQEKLRRPWWGYHQLAEFRSHVYPYDEPGPGVVSYKASADAGGLFAMGTTSWTGVVHLEHSLGWLLDTGVESIQKWRQPMVDRVQHELRRRGYEPLTPEGSRTPMVAFALRDARAKLAERLREAQVRITVSQHRFRVSIGVFNDMDDIDRLLGALPKSPPS